MSTPLMKQYHEVKSNYPDCVLFFRMGDFYELFGDDAVIAARILGITLTKRNNGKEGEMPLCGFPWHAAERYVPKMVAQGHKIAICEQIEDPKQAKGIVKRDVVEVITAGTALSDSNLDAKSNNYIVALNFYDQNWQIACLDLSTGDFSLAYCPEHMAECELNRLHPVEVILSNHQAEEIPAFVDEYLELERARLSQTPLWRFDEESALEFLQERVRLDDSLAHGGLGAAAALLYYAEDLKKRRLEHIDQLQIRTLGAHMLLDPQTLRNLELIRPLNSEDTDATLLAVLDHTGTSMGGRLLRQWISHPLLSIPAIEERFDALAEMGQDLIRQDELKKSLTQINDIERINGKVGSGRANARDLQGLGKSLLLAQEISSSISTCSSALLQRCTLDHLDLHSKAEIILSTLQDDVPTSLREGGLIRAGASEELDALNEGIREAREWLSGLESRERERTGISSLKVGFNKVFGYYLEVTTAQMDKVPDNYIRKQTLSTGERYITPEMKEYESLILGAEGRIFELEYKLFGELRESVHAWAAELSELAQKLATLDVILSLSIAARKENYCRPVLSEDPILIAKGVFHPVIVRKMNRDQFICNDIDLQSDQAKLMLITGPNMAGKSTYLRQVALITLMAQMGCFVPATEAVVGVADRIFTRVGASDRLARGQSTFMVEMVETAHILQHASPRSLVILDEIGRGTSTYDGLSLAWSIFEYLHDHPSKRSRTLFATHYHEMTELAERLERAGNFHISVKEVGRELLFLRKILPGACDSSYGIQVARMAGVPEQVIVRAEELLLEFEQQGIRPENLAIEHVQSQSANPQELQSQDLPKSLSSKKTSPKEQLDLFAAPALSPIEARVLEQIKQCSVDQIRPVDALVLLDQLRKQLLN